MGIRLPVGAEGRGIMGLVMAFLMGILCWLVDGPAARTHARRSLEMDWKSFHPESAYCRAAPEGEARPQLVTRA